MLNAEKYKGKYQNITIKTYALDLELISVQKRLFNKKAEAVIGGMVVACTAW